MRIVLTTLHSKYIHASLALPLLGAYCQDICNDLRIREFTVHEPKEQVLGSLLAEEPEVIAFSVYLWNRRQTLELADALVTARPNLRIVLGGPEVSFEGPELLETHFGISALIRGEGELPLHGLLEAWQQGLAPTQVPRLTWRDGDRICENPDGPLLTDLDAIPSPLQLGLMDLGRGFVYLETSRGCPYRCAFCMSALDQRVRSYSMARIEQDLKLLMDRRVAKVKLVDRTFNYDPKRARRIFAFILQHNHSSHFHFEIGGHLLDEKTLELLATVPKDTFQFEIGVQSTLPETLRTIDRPAALELLEQNVRRLRQMGNIHLHLDLIAGLPGEDYGDFLASIDRVAALRPHHLQLEPVKLLPGAPLRHDAARHGISFDPHPPYSVLATQDLSFTELERLQGIGRLLDLTINTDRGHHFLTALSEACGSLSSGLEQLESFWRRQGLFRRPLSQRDLFNQLWTFVNASFTGQLRARLGECLGWDLAISERIPQEKAPDYLDTTLTDSDRLRVRAKMQRIVAALKGRGIKVQHLAARLHHQPQLPEGRLVLFLYLTRPGRPFQIRQLLL
ncbi:B12-binding domain-containing radical SAM protein [Syntrophotalea acetylenivorans]|uniref:B12-binding domain-containing radical SAM protein n=1 Tax=Syntrophotalea acetylenivorans TaxID=1842532 RepID=A0A1L3GT31_9BACT|nr:B12-binding domain-containing radical SAM protein [Syntrophotalea acetylenivorans]APG29114.1 B12-binding domain-containing radical SAM protein [Syntrophotalea acetylenivorans]